MKRYATPKDLEITRTNTTENERKKKDRKKLKHRKEYKNVCSPSAIKVSRREREKEK